MPGHIVKPSRDRDFYVRWSTVVDDVTACGSRAELTEYLAKFHGYIAADPARFDRADESGSSAVEGSSAWFGWDDDTFVLRQYEEDRAVKRADLEAYAIARCADNEGEALKHTYVLPDDDSHQSYLDAEADAEMLPDPTEPPETN